MARTITLIDNEDNPVSRWHKVTIDAVNSHIEIHKECGETITYLDRISSVFIRPYKIVLYLENGFYFVINP
jgi:hypothetical protein